MLFQRNGKVQMSRKLVAEFLGTLLLLAIVVGSGIMGEQLSQGNAAIALLANSFATGLGLFVLITVLGPVSGAHFNPLVTLIEYIEKQKNLKETGFFLCAQISGAFVGVLTAHLMFGEDYFSFSAHERGGIAQMFSEFVATFGLIFVIRMLVQAKSTHVPAVIGAYIASAYWFTASTSFANPAVTLARAFTDSFSGIQLTHVAGFVLAQVLGAFVADLVFRLIFKERD